MGRCCGRVAIWQGSGDSVRVRTRCMWIIRRRGRARARNVNVLSFGGWICSRLRWKGWFLLDWRRCRRSWGRHHSTWRTVLNDGTIHRLSYCRNRRTWSLIFDGIHGSFEDVWLDGYGTCPKLRHRVLGWIVFWLLGITLLLRRFRPVLLEYALAQPFRS
jgi:hypothetical protein